MLHLPSAVYLNLIWRPWTDLTAQDGYLGCRHANNANTCHSEYCFWKYVMYLFTIYLRRTPTYRAVLVHVDNWWKDCLPDIDRYRDIYRTIMSRILVYDDFYGQLNTSAIMKTYQKQINASAKWYHKNIMYSSIYQNISYNNRVIYKNVPGRTAQLSNLLFWNFNIIQHEEWMLDRWTVGRTGRCDNNWPLPYNNREKTKILNSWIHWLSFFRGHKNVMYLLLYERT